MEKLKNTLESYLNGPTNEPFQTKKYKKGKLQNIAGPTISEVQETIQNTEIEEIQLKDLAQLLKILLHYQVKNFDLQSTTKQLEDKLKVAEQKIDEQAQKIKEQDAKINDHEEKMRIQKDYMDEVHQRSLKGNLILSSGNQDGLIKSPDSLEAEKKSVVNHATELIKRKYGVDLPADDIQAAHHLPSAGKNGSKTEYKAILVRVWNRKPGSAWCDLVKNISTGGEKNVNIYANFQLTATRNSLLYNLRQLKKKNAIHKFYTTENGEISYKNNEKSVKKYITYSAKNPKTYSNKELQASFNCK